MYKNVVIIIPSRIGSTRLNRKPLLEIDSKPMIICCADKARAANVGKVYVACDSPEIAELCKKYDYEYIMTNSSIPTGSDRVHAAFQMLNSDFEYVVNLQGDMPRIQPNTIACVVNALINDTKFDIMSAITTFCDDDEKADVNNVSAIVSHVGKNDELVNEDVVQALYFTRTSQPYPKSVYKHIGIYAYRAPALQKFISLPQSRLEIEERLEQLRALENQMRIGCVFVNDHVISLDTPHDLQRLLSE